MKYQIFAIPILSVIPALMSVNPARAGLGSWVNEFGDKIAKVADITDKNSDARRILRNVDITNPNSPACNTLRTGGDDVAAASSTTGPKGMAVAAAITTAKKICGNAASGKAISPEQAEVDMAVMYQTQLAIEQAKQNGETERVKTLESAKIKMEELRQGGETRRVEIVQENLLAMTLSNNQTEIKKAELHLKEVESNNWTDLEKAKVEGNTSIVTTGITTLGQWLTGGQQTSAQVEIAKLNAANEARRIENERLRIELEKNKNTIAAQPQVNHDLIRQEVVNDPSTRGSQPIAIQNSNIALLQSWGLTSTTCSSVTASITIDGKQYCANATEKLRAGQYAYNPATKRLQPLNPVPGQPSDSNLAMLKNWGLTIATCNASAIFIYIDNKWYCAMPNGRFSAGKYVYDRTANKLRNADTRSSYPPAQSSNADNRTASPPARSSSGFK